MLAPATVGAEVIGIVDVREGCGLELGVFHAPKLAHGGCGSLVYKSYSRGTRRGLYKLYHASLCLSGKNTRAIRPDVQDPRNVGGLAPLEIVSIPIERPGRLVGSMSDEGRQLIAA
jgi:hypothetical protein